MQNNPNENLPEGEQTLVDAKVYLGERFGLDDAGVERLFPQLADVPEDGKVVFKEHSKEKSHFAIEVKGNEGILLCDLDVYCSLNGDEDPNVIPSNIPDIMRIPEAKRRDAEKRRMDEGRSQFLPEDFVVGGDLTKGLRSGEKLDHDEIDWHAPEGVAEQAAIDEQQAFYDAMEGWGESDLRELFNDPNRDKAAAARRRLTELQAASIEHDDASAFDLKKGLRSGEKLDHDKL